MTNAANAKPAKKKQGKSLFRRINDFLHLWMGLISGLIVFVVSITGCIWVFEREISSATQPYQHVTVEQKAYLPPSTLKAIAEKYTFGDSAGMGPTHKVTGMDYPGEGKAAIGTYRSKERGFIMIYMNPYTGKVLHEKELEKDFFRWILKGHFNLWLPRDIGQPIVCWAIGIFILLMISGLIMWWPKKLNKANVDKSFKIKWGASFKRVNYDLHNVLGFYVMLIGLIIAITGIGFGFKWVGKTIYYTASGGKSLPERAKVFSDTTHIVQFTPASQEDKIWLKMYNDYGIAQKRKEGLFVQFAAKQSDAISITHNPDKKTFYKSQTRYFDQYTLAEIKTPAIFNHAYEEATVADKINRMNYDIHIGAILGFPGKILAFCASLICASLPVTGFLIWWGRKKKNKKADKKPPAQMAKKLLPAVVE